MSIRPILFNTEMVQAILEGRKTVTRRVVKTAHGGTLEVHDDIGGTARLCERCGAMCKGLNPPYNTGDVLWVRETFSPVWIHPIRYLYKCFCTEAEGLPVRWHPSIHMPKAAARLFLRATAVRVERLQDISSFDVLGEGIFDGECNRCREEAGGCYPQKDEDVFCGREDILADKYADLWNSTIKPTDLPRYGWDANLWVWVIAFERCERPEGWA